MLVKGGAAPFADALKSGKAAIRDVAVRAEKPYPAVISEKLGMRAISYLPAWVTALLWTIFFAEGAGFGSATYTNECGGQPYSCHLVHHALFPPQVALTAFAGNVASLWADGMYDVGFQLALFTLIALLVSASQLNRFAAKRVFSWPVILPGCATFAAAGYFYEIHQTLSTGIAHVPLL